MKTESEFQKEEENRIKDCIEFLHDCGYVVYDENKKSKNEYSVLSEAENYKNELSKHVGE